jgi:TolA-binding protein
MKRSIARQLIFMIAAGILLLVFTGCVSAHKMSPPKKIMLEEQTVEGKIRRPQLVLIKADPQPSFDDTIGMDNAPLPVKSIIKGFVQYHTLKVTKETVRKEIIKKHLDIMADTQYLALDTALQEKRSQIINTIEKQVELDKRGKYAPQLLFRLADLYHDQSSENFDRELRSYEQAIKAGTNSNTLSFPEYHLEKSIDCYTRIYNDFPDASAADRALFFKANALAKEGKESEENEVFNVLVSKYPQSKYYIEASMGIGHYYYDHPRLNNGKGYLMAEKAFQKALVQKNGPQYIEALYMLGWCHYMQDKYDETLKVLAYMIDSIGLKFDDFKSEKNQIANPLLRDEAIEEMAISLDMKYNSVQDALDFLNRIHNEEYEATVLMRMGESHEKEDLNFPKAESLYLAICKHYPNSMEALHATLNLIGIYKKLNASAKAQSLTNDLEKEYGPGSKWAAISSERKNALQKALEKK